MRTVQFAAAVVLAIALQAGCHAGDAGGFDGVGFDEARVATVRIGDRTWMARNLDITLYPGGGTIPCLAYDDDPALAAQYGRLYTWAEALEAAPPGWHLPSREEWQALFDHLGGIGVAGGKMKTVDYWNPPNVGASNSSGFAALPAGGSDGQRFDGLGWSAHFWSGTSEGGGAAAPSLLNAQENAYWLVLGPAMRASVRYVRD